jgi:hypothetical protein
VTDIPAVLSEQYTAATATDIQAVLPHKCMAVSDLTDIPAVLSEQYTAATAIDIQAVLPHKCMAVSGRD